MPPSRQAGGDGNHCGVVEGSRSLIGASLVSMASFSCSPSGDREDWSRLHYRDRTGLGLPLAPLLHISQAYLIEVYSKQPCWTQAQPTLLIKPRLAGQTFCAVRHRPFNSSSHPLTLGSTRAHGVHQRSLAECKQAEQTELHRRQSLAGAGVLISDRAHTIDGVRRASLTSWSPVASTKLYRVRMAHLFLWSQTIHTDRVINSFIRTGSQTRALCLQLVCFSFSPLKRASQAGTALWPLQSGLELQNQTLCLLWMVRCLSSLH